MSRADEVQREWIRLGLAAVNACHHVSTGNLIGEEIGEETIADVIADVLHLAVSLGLDPDETLDHGRRYFEGDQEQLEQA